MSIKNTGVSLSSDLVTVCHQIGLRGRKNFAQLYGRIPLSVSMDKRLKTSDKLVYLGLSYYAWQGTIVKRSFSDIAEAAGISARSVARSIKTLIKYGHIKSAGENKERYVGSYHLTSPVFGQKQRSGKTEIAYPPKSCPRYVSVA